LAHSRASRVRTRPVSAKSRNCTADAHGTGSSGSTRLCEYRCVGTRRLRLSPVGGSVAGEDEQADGDARLRNLTSSSQFPETAESHSSSTGAWSRQLSARQAGSTTCECKLHFTCRSQEANDDLTGAGEMRPVREDDSSRSDVNRSPFSARPSHFVPGISILERSGGRWTDLAQKVKRSREGRLAVAGGPSRVRRGDTEERRRS
jgi:hypothetical protein